MLSQSRVTHVYSSHMSLATCRGYVRLRYNATFKVIFVVLSWVLEELIVGIHQTQYFALRQVQCSKNCLLICTFTGTLYF
jgi:hypothetical protein